jgi:diguanylate cyclase (GGDEF)-like protein
MSGALPADMTMSVRELGRLMPMFLWIAPTGQICAAGPTLSKVCGAGLLSGARFFDVFDLTKPSLAATMADLARLTGQRLQVRLRHGARTALRGQIVPLAGQDGLLVNLSFGIAVAEAVRDHRLTDADFATTDLTVELLYLTEAKAAVMEELAALNRRLDTARNAAEARALTDALTGLANRRALAAALARAVDAAARGRRGFALLHLDLDLFKAVNDTLGHAAGDFVLTRVAAVLRAETRKQDTVARVGGDEFVLILPGQVDPAQIDAVARRIIEGLETPLVFEGRPCRISGSIGATVSCLYPVPEADRMLNDADTALYASKRRGRGRATIYAPDLRLPEDRRAPEQPGPGAGGSGAG